MWRQAALLGVLIAQPAYADLITVSTNAEVSALFGDFSSTTPNTDSSASNSGSVSTSQADNRSFTSADITAFNFDTGTDTFSASALIIAEKTVSARPGGDHTGIASYEVSFTVDSQMDYTLSGTWGFLNNAAAGPADLLTYSLVDSGGATLDSGSTTANVLTDPFSSSGTLAAGSYTFLIYGELNETINNQGTVTAAWDLQQFTLTNAAVPEPGAAVLMVMCIAILGVRRQRRLVKV